MMISIPRTQTADQIYQGVSVKICHAICIAMLTVLIILISACGKKAPPIPQTYVAPPLVVGLKVTLENDIMTLQWPVPEWKEKGENALAGFYVYRSQQALSNTGCEDCPVRYQRAADSRIGNNNSNGSYTEPLDQGFRYSFKVSAYTDSGYEGEMSEAVTLDY